MLIILGANGQIGKSLIRYCKQNHYEFLAPSKDELNCFDLDGIVKYFEKYQPTYLINLVGYNGGIEFNRLYPEAIYRNTVQLNMNIFIAAAKCNIKKIVSPMTSCAYPFHLAVMKEEQLYDGPCHPSVECHGLAKRAIYSYAVQSNKEFGNRFVFTCFNNNYGPNFYFDRPQKLKVADSMVKRFVDAKNDKVPSVTFWGDGTARRELLYAFDSASALIFALNHFNDYDLPILNMGSGKDVLIKDLAYLIRNKTGFNGDILWDESKPNGQMSKLLDVTRATKLGWSPFYDLETGLEFTIDWYQEQLKCTI